MKNENKSWVWMIITMIHNRNSQSIWVFWIICWTFQICLFLFLCNWVIKRFIHWILLLLLYFLMIMINHKWYQQNSISNPNKNYTEHIITNKWIHISCFYKYYIRTACLSLFCVLLFAFSFFSFSNSFCRLMAACSFSCWAFISSLYQ